MVHQEVVDTPHSLSPGRQDEEDGGSKRVHRLRIRRGFAPVSLNVLYPKGLANNAKEKQHMKALFSTLFVIVSLFISGCSTATSGSNQSATLCAEKHSAPTEQEIAASEFQKDERIGAH